MARQHPLAVIKQARQLTDSVLIGISGGKESLAVLNLCRDLKFKRIAGYFLYVVPNLSFEQSILDYCEKRYDIVIHQLPHWGLSELVRYEDFRLPNVSKEPGHLITLVDAEDHARRLSGIQWIATGQRKDDSLERRAMIVNCGGINIKARRFYPLAEWGERHVFSYLRQHNIPVPTIYQWRPRNWGGSLHVDSLEVIRKEYPADYDKIVERFPLLDAQFLREKIANERASQRVSGADAADSPQPDQLPSEKPARLGQSRTQETQG